MIYTYKNEQTYVLNHIHRNKAWQKCEYMELKCGLSIKDLLKNVQAVYDYSIAYEPGLPLVI